MKRLPIILYLMICASNRTLPAEPEPFRLQLNGQSTVSLRHLDPLVSTFFRQQEALHSIVNQRPRGEVLKPPAAIASKLSTIETGMSRAQTEEILGNGWIEIGGGHWNSGYLAEYVNRAFPNLMIQVWYGWTERPFAEGRLIRRTGPKAPILAPPAVLETKLLLPGAK